MAIQSAPIPVKGSPQYIAEAIVDTDVSPNLYNGYINHLDTAVGMPGLTEFFDVGTAAAIDGMFWWESQASLVVVSNGHIFKKTTKAVGTGWADVTGTATDLIVGNKCTFADFDTKLVIANGGKMKVLPDSGGAYDMASVNAPTVVKFVTQYDSYCIALQDVTGYFFWSNVGDCETWDGDFNSAQTHPDTTNAIRTGWGELILTGTKSFEVWRNDGTTPFVPNRNAYSETGVLAPHSLILINGVWCMLTDDRQVVFLQGRFPKSLSSSLDAYIGTFTTINDCRSSMLQIDGVDYLMLTFLTEGKCILVKLTPDKATGQHIWSVLNDWLDPNWLQFPAQDSVVCGSWNMVVYGGVDDGLVYYMDYSSELYDTRDIRTVYRTQWIDREYFGEKRSYGVRAFIKRMIPATAALVVGFRYRDNGSQTWSSWIDTTYSSTSDYTELLRYDGPMGMYQTRQFEFKFSGEPRVALARADELLETSYV